VCTRAARALPARGAAWKAGRVEPFDPNTVQRGLTLSALAKASAGLDDATFSSRFAPGFLMLKGQLNAVQGPAQTDIRPRAAIVDGEARFEDENTSDVKILVFLLRRRPISTHDFISIGRVDGNDIALPDESVSKFHAYVKDIGGALHLQDARSRNGTMIGSQPVAARGAGPAVALQHGQVIQFGSVATTYHAASPLLALLRRISKS
jgi:hypothetical protein